MRVVVITSLLALAAAKDIVVFGDSWGTEGAVSFDNMAKSHGLTVDNHAVAGSTAQEWSLVPNKLTDWVKKNPDAKYVWITIGGNDAAPMLQAGKDVATIKADVKKWVQKFLDPLFAALPKIKVVAFGYDILFWDYPECLLEGDSIFARCGKRGQSNFTACANKLFYNVQALWEDLSKEYTTKGFSLTSPNLLGSFQKAGGVPGADVGKPNDNYFSPNKLTGPLKFCLHANDEGFDHIFSNLWDLYFSKHEVAQILKFANMAATTAVF